MGDIKDVSASEISGQEKEDAKRKKLLKVLWPATEIGGGFSKAYFSTYANYLYTNVYVFGALFSGILSILKSAIGWIGGPVFGTLIDRVSFKKGKYYPWIIIGQAICFGAWILLFSLPVFGISTDIMRPIAMALVVICSAFGTIAVVPVHGVFPQIAKDTKERQFMAMIQKICRDGGKTVFGYICPAILMFFMSRIDESKAYAVTGLIVGILAFSFYLALGLGLRGSYVERNAMERTRQVDGRKKRMSIVKTFKTVFTNRALVSMYFYTSLQKSFYFIFLFNATYLFKYMYDDFGKMGTFMLVFNLSAILGAMFGPIAQKVIKEVKQLVVICTGAQIVVLVIIAIFLRQMSAATFIAVFAVASFFMGIVESFFMPMFAASSDYCSWKTGVSMDGLNMSVYTLSINTGILIAPIIATGVLTAINLDGIIAGAAISEAFLGGLNVLFGWIPVAFCIASLVAFMFFPLSGTRIARINEDLAAGKTMSTSEHKF